MTSISISKNGDKYKMVAQGHAEYQPGNDIVCAACSTLAYTLASTLAVNHIKYRDMFKSGYAEVEAIGEAAHSYFLMAYVGYQSLEDNYPDHVEVMIDGFDIEK